MCGFFLKDMNYGYDYTTTLILSQQVVHNKEGITINLHKTNLQS